MNNDSIYNGSYYYSVIKDRS